MKISQLSYKKCVFLIIQNITSCWKTLYIYVYI